MISTVIEIPTFAIILGSKALFPGGLPSVRWLPEQNDTSPLPMTAEDYISSDYFIELAENGTCRTDKPWGK